MLTLFNSYHDSEPHISLCVSAQKYYEQQDLKTMVLAASFTSTDEIMSLAGVNHLTVSQALLQDLATSSPSASTPDSLFGKELDDIPHVPEISINDRDKFVASLEDTDNGGRMAQVCSDSRVVESDQPL